MTKEHKLDKGYGFLRRRKCFGQMDVWHDTPCESCSDEEFDKCYSATYGESDEEQQ
jgi:hypothetical protein